MTGAPAILLVPGTANDRNRIARIRAPAGLASFVHYNWFWLDRALADPGIRFRLVRRGARRGLAGVVAFGAHEAIDLDPASRRDDIGEIYHIVIDRSFAKQGLGGATIALAVAALVEAMPKLRAVRVAHHPKNFAAARLYAKLGFVGAGEKFDAETGVKDVLLELAGPALKRLNDGRNAYATASTSPPRAS